VGRRLIPPLVLLLLAVGLQTLIPLASGALTIANPYLALLVTLGIRSGKMGGLLWGAGLGLLSDAYFSPFLGFHGLSFCVIGYLLGWLGGKLLVQSVLPMTLFTLCASVLDAAAVAGLYLLLGLPLASPLWIPVLLGSILTALIEAVLEPVARRLYRRGPR
jgi:rod shape-determining protein MreD